MSESFAEGASAADAAETAAGAVITEQFFRVDPEGAVSAFLADWCCGPFPAAAVLNHNGEIVVANGDRTMVAVVFAAAEGGFCVHVYDDVMNMIDPDGEPTDSLSHEDVQDAFAAACASVGCPIEEMAPLPAG